MWNLRSTEDENNRSWEEELSCDDELTRFECKVSGLAKTIIQLKGWGRPRVKKPSENHGTC